MKATRFLPLAVLLCASCSPDPTGLYKNQSGNESYDFRSDKTAQFDSSTLYDSGVGIISTKGTGGGVWKIEGGKLIFAGLVAFRSSTSYGPETTDTNAIIVEFTFEPNGDLLTVPGESYKQSVRFIKQQ